MTPDELKRLRGIAEQSGLQQTAINKTPAAPKKGRSGLLKWLPTALGVAGTLAAAPLTGGASLAGTAAILGGAAAAGSGLGELGAQVFNKEDINVGRIGKEALISGVTGAIPIGGAAKAAKVAKTAGTVAKEAGKEVVEETAKKTIKGRFAKAGEEMIAAQQGTVTGAVMKGGKRVTPKLESEVTGYLKEIGAKGTPKDKLVQLAADKEATGLRIGELVKAADAPVTVGDLSRITGKVQRAGITAKNVSTETTNAYRGAIGGAKTKQELQAIKGELDDELASFYKRVDAGTATKAEERVLKGYRDGINDVLKDIPGYSEANKRFATSLKAEELLLKAPKAGNVRILGVDTGIGGKGVQRGKDLAGRVMQSGANAIPALPAAGSGLTSRVLREGIKQEIGGAVGGMLLPETPELDTTQLDQTVLPDDTASEDLNTLVDDTDKMQAGLKQAALKALAAGDTKGLENIIKTASMLESLGAIGAKAEKPAKKTEGQRARDNAARLTEKAISQLGAGSVNTGLVSGNFEKVKGIFGKADPESLQFNTTVSNLMAVIAKANAGTSFTDGEKALLKQYSPSVGDSGQVLRAKLSALRDVFAQAQAAEYGQEYQPDVIGVQ